MHNDGNGGWSDLTLLIFNYNPHLWVEYVIQYQKIPIKNTVEAETVANPIDYLCNSTRNYARVKGFVKI